MTYSIQTSIRLTIPTIIVVYTLVPSQYMVKLCNTKYPKCMCVCKNRLRPVIENKTVHSNNTCEVQLNAFVLTRYSQLARCPRRHDDDTSFLFAQHVRLHKNNCPSDFLHASDVTISILTSYIECLALTCAPCLS